MQKKNLKQRIDWGQIAGIAFFILLFIGLIFLGLFYDSDVKFENSFFEDIGRVMEWK